MSDDTKRLIAVNGPFTLYALDEPDPNGGGACHLYAIFDEEDNEVFRCHFQQGPLKEAGPNGAPDLLVGYMLADRLAAFQEGTFASPFNEWALNGLEVYTNSQRARNRDREERQVEGHNKK